MYIPHGAQAKQSGRHQKGATEQESKAQLQMRGRHTEGEAPARVVYMRLLPQQLRRRAGGRLERSLLMSQAGRWPARAQNRDTLRAAGIRKTRRARSDQYAGAHSQPLSLPSRALRTTRSGRDRRGFTRGLVRGPAAVVMLPLLVPRPVAVPLPLLFLGRPRLRVAAERGSRGRWPWAKEDPRRAVVSLQISRSLAPLPAPALPLNGLNGSKLPSSSPVPNN